MALNKKSPNAKRKLSRKQQRKEMRKQKKNRKNDYYTNRNKPGRYVLNPNKTNENPPEELFKNDSNEDQNNSVSSGKTVLTTEQIRNKEQRVKRKIEKQMMVSRKKQLIEANEEEDRIIKQLEKQLGLNKRKTKTLPKSFVNEGLDYLLEVVDPERMKNALNAEREMYNDDEDDFNEDFALMTEDKVSEVNEEEKCDENDDEEDRESVEEDDNDSEEFEEKLLEEGESSTDIEGSENESSDEETPPEKKKKLILKKEEETFSENSEEENEQSVPHIKGAVKINVDGTWEDIYGRLRANDGSVITKENQMKYVPPAVREKLAAQDGKNTQRLRRELKGLLNKLAESNMHSIATQIENLYMNNSRNDMNETLMNLIFDSILTEILTPERLLIEHVVLIAVLHANVGTEIGAHFLQESVKKFDHLVTNTQEIEDKTLDNTVKFLSQMYNFKIFDSKLMYDIINKLLQSFGEKEIECILHILRNIGFNLRKDDPLALKSLILDLQKRATNTGDKERDNSRVKFMLDILLAIKNNNVTKIPNYDVSYPEHLKKILKSLVRKGNYVTQLNISLDDLLNAEEKGKWWVVGSAWSGKDSNLEKNEQKSTGYDTKLLQLAKKQRMNTDTRRNIFCIIMSAEDYLDAFEKIVKLGLKNQQEREIINVILQCCLQEKIYNPYYAYLAQKFCDYNRRFQIIIKYSVWDKLKALDSHSGPQISNLAKLLIHLFIEKGLPMSTLKVLQFSEIDKITLRFMRQILIGILLVENEESCIEVFSKIQYSDKLKIFRESLKLFIHHFMLRNLKSDTIPESKKILFESRAKMVEKLLSAKSL